MHTFPLTVSTPDGHAFQGDAIQLDLRGIEGDLAVLAGHTPFITPVQPGKFHLFLPDDTMKTGRLSGGLLTVNSDAVTLLTDTVEWE